MLAQPIRGACPFAGCDIRARVQHVRELLRSNDPVLLSFADALLKEAGIAHSLVDQNMSVIEGSIGILPRRMVVPEDQIEDARRVLTEAGLARELPDRST